MTPTNGKSAETSEVLPGYKGPFTAGMQYNAEDTGAEAEWLVQDSGGATVIECAAQDTAQALVRCLNSHGAVVEACKKALADRFGGNDPCCDKDAINNELRAAIEAAGGTWQ